MRSRSSPACGRGRQEGDGPLELSRDGPVECAIMGTRTSLDHNVDIVRSPCQLF